MNIRYSVNEGVRSRCGIKFTQPGQPDSSSMCVHHALEAGISQKSHFPILGKESSLFPRMFGLLSLLACQHPNPVVENKRIWKYLEPCPPLPRTNPRKENDLTAGPAQTIQCPGPRSSSRKGRKFFVLVLSFHYALSSSSFLYDILGW